MIGYFVGISEAAPGRTTVDPAAGASARRREGQRVDAEPSQRRVAPAISLLAAILFFSGVVVTITCLSLPPNCLRFVSVHELNAFRIRMYILCCVFPPLASRPFRGLVDANKDRPRNGLGIGTGRGKGCMQQLPSL